MYIYIYPSLSTRFGNDCKFSHVLEENAGFGPQERRGGFGRRSSPPITGGFDNRFSGFGGGGGGQGQNDKQQSTFGSFRPSSSGFKSFQSSQNFHQGNGGGGGGGFGFGSVQQHPSNAFANQTGFGSSQQMQVNNTTPSSHGYSGGGVSRNIGLNTDFSSTVGRFYHTGDLLLYNWKVSYLCYAHRIGKLL